MTARIRPALRRLGSRCAIAVGLALIWAWWLYATITGGGLVTSDPAVVPAHVSATPNVVCPDGAVIRYGVCWPPPSSVSGATNVGLP